MFDDRISEELEAENPKLRKGNERLWTEANELRPLAGENAALDRKNVELQAQVDRLDSIISELVGFR